MAKSQETWNKKENEKKRKKKKEDKVEKKLERKANAGSGSLDDMMAYVDEYGNISSTPPDPLKKKKIRADEIELGVPKRDPSIAPGENRTGVITFFNDSKGYGFIRDLASQESIFVHVNALSETVKENTKVSFQVEKGHKGLNAIQVKVI